MSDRLRCRWGRRGRLRWRSARRSCWLGRRRVIGRSTLRGRVVIRCGGIARTGWSGVYGRVVRLRRRWHGRRVEWHHKRLRVRDHSTGRLSGTTSWRLGLGRRHSVGGICWRNRLPYQLAGICELSQDEELHDRKVKCSYKVVTDTFCVSDHQQRVYLRRRTVLVALGDDHRGCSFLELRGPAFSGPQ